MDSQAAIKSRDSEDVRSKTVLRCRNSLNRICNTHYVSLCWVPRHRNIKGNETADRLAKNGSALDFQHTECVSVDVPIGALKKEIDLKAREMSNSAWSARSDCDISRS